MFEGVTSEELDAQELRAKGSQRARAHQVVQDRCPACGSRLAASLVAEVRRDWGRCPTAVRVSAVFRGSVDDLLEGIERFRGGAA